MLELLVELLGLLPIRGLLTFLLPSLKIVKPRLKVDLCSPLVQIKSGLMTW